MVWGKHGHAPCKTSSSKNPHGSQLLWLPTSVKVWVGSTCLPYGGRCCPGVCKFSLLYGGRPDGRFEVRVGMWNVGSLSGQGGEVCQEPRKRMIDVCCLKEVRWR